MGEPLPFELERTKCIAIMVPTEKNKFNVDKKKRIKFLEQAGEGDPFIIKLFIHSATIIECLLCFSYCGEQSTHISYTCGPQSLI